MTIFAGIGSKVTFALVSMGLLTAATAGVGLVVFSNVAAQVEEVTEARVPEIQNATRLIISASKLTELLNQIVTARTSEDVSRTEADLRSSIKTIRTNIGLAEEAVSAELARTMDATEQNLISLRRAREAEFDNTQRITATVKQLENIDVVLSKNLTELVDDAYFQVVLGGEEAIVSVGRTVNHLVEVDFQKSIIAQQIRAEMNLISGIYIAILQTRDPSLSPIFTDLGVAATQRLDRLTSELEAFDLPEETMKSISGAASFFANGLLSPPRNSSSGISESLSARQTADAALSGLIDDMSFELMIDSETALETNSKTIQGLMDDQVSGIQNLLSLQVALKDLMGIALSSVSAENPAQLATLQERLTAGGNVVRKGMSDGSSVIKDEIERVLEIIAPETGIASLRLAELNAQDEAGRASSLAVQSVTEIADMAGSLGIISLDRIAASGTALTGEVSRARMATMIIAAVSAVVFLLTKYLISRTVVSPLNKLCQTTERLSGGDMALIEGLDGQAGEIGRMANALSVFRENALKMEQLRADSAAQDEAAKQAQRDMLNLLSEEIGTVVGAGSRGNFSHRVEHEFVDPEIASLARNVNGLLSATERGLNETRNALQAISNADLTHRMSSDFEGVFAQLSDDVNHTSHKLTDMIEGIRSAARISGERVRQVSDGANTLAKRAENQAASIQETTASMEVMAEGVNANSKMLTEAEKRSTLVASKTQDGRAAAEEAVRNVEDIAKISDKITEINGVIEAIAFQTNLLALNAAVEAARAGDAGKGFAVVASEVRTLAQRSSDAAGEIGSLVTRSAQSVKSGVASVEATRAALTEIETSVAPVVDVLLSVAQSGREQAASISEVNVAIRTMDQSTQENAQQAEMSTSHVKDLLDQIQGLEKLVSSFKVSSRKASSGNAGRIDAA